MGVAVGGGGSCGGGRARWHAPTAATKRPGWRTGLLCSVVNVPLWTSGPLSFETSPTPVIYLCARQR